MPYHVKIDGNEITELKSVTASVVASLNEKGDRVGFSYPLHVTATRDASVHPELTGLNGAVKNPKRVKVIVEMVDVAGKVVYTITLNKAFVASWRLNSFGDSGAPVLETIEVFGGDVEMQVNSSTAESAEGAKKSPASATGSAKYKLGDFN